jgi:hypothetical protein
MKMLASRFTASNSGGAKRLRAKPWLAQAEGFAVYPQVASSCYIEAINRFKLRHPLFSASRSKMPFLQLALPPPPV